LGSYKTYVGLISVVLLALMVGYQNAIVRTAGRVESQPTWLSDELEKIATTSEMKMDCYFRQDGLDTHFVISETGDQRRLEFAFADQSEVFHSNLDSLEKTIRDDGTVIYKSADFHFEVPNDHSVVDSKKQFIPAHLRYETNSLVLDAAVKCELSFR
jgi:hypothetical protein